jgi:inner membrane protease ATP23
MLDETTPLIRNCYDRARQCIASNESIRRLLDALSSHGCPFNFDRHLICEINRKNLRGGFDRSTCQIVLYPENLHSLKEFCTIFQHELIHAYDYCRVKIDFKNPFHLACTEIRAASLSNQCSLFNHFSTSSRPFLLKNQHSICVQNRARQSMKICSNLSREKHDQIINDVFIRCYNDTDPFDELERTRRGQ